MNLFYNCQIELRGLKIGLISFWNEPSGLAGNLSDLKGKEKKYIATLIDEQMKRLDEKIEELERKFGRKE